MAQMQNMDEACLTSSGRNRNFGQIINPVDRDLSILGSSSGSAAFVATELGSFSLGTDFGGSCRLPAIATGLIGFRFGTRTFPKDGIWLASDRFDSLGIISNSTETLATVIDTIANKQVLRDCAIGDPSSLNIIVPSLVSLKTSVSTPVLTQFTEHLELLKDMGFNVTESTTLSTLLKMSYRIRKVLGAFDICSAILATPEIHRKVLTYPPFRGIKKFAESFSPSEIFREEQGYENILKKTERLFTPDTFLVTPAIACEIPAATENDIEAAMAFPIHLFLALANVCGTPAITCNPLKNKSLHLQIIGGPGKELDLVQLGAFDH